MPKKSDYIYKNTRILMHKFAALHMLLMETMDELDTSEEFRLQHSEVFDPALKHIEKVLDTLSDSSEQVQYLSDLSDKIHTVIRKNYMAV